MPSITVKHNIEIAHRLTVLQGKCQNIHGHSMKVHLELYVEFEDGYARDEMDEILDYGKVKEKFRSYLNENYDHRLVLNEDDVWALRLWTEDGSIKYPSDTPHPLPGLKKVPGDPTTENLAMWIAGWAKEEFGMDCQVVIWETETNATSCGA